MVHTTLLHCTTRCYTSFDETGVWRIKLQSSGEEYTWDGKPSKHQIMGWRAVSAAELQGNGLPKWTLPGTRYATGVARSFFTDTDMPWY